MQKSVVRFALSSSFLLVSVNARAELEPDLPPAFPPLFAAGPEADHPADATERQTTDKGATPGFQIEAGAATTHVTHGVAKYATKTTPSTEDLALLRVNDLGPGTLTAGTAFSAALASASTQPKSSTEYVPQLTYGGRFRFVEATAGFQMKLQPRASDIDNSYEGIARFAIPNRHLMPTLELYPELVRKRGAYAIFGAERSFSVASWFTVRPRAAFGEQGYAVKAERLHAQDVTASVLLKANIDETFYAALKPAYSYLVGPGHDYANASRDGRSLAYVVFALGAQR